MERIELDLFTKFKYISQMKSNPSQSVVAFLSAKADVEKNKYVYEMYKIENYKMSKVFNLKTHGQFIWEDDNTVLFPYEKNKTEEKLTKEFYTIYYRYRIDQKKLEKAYVFPMPVSIIKVLEGKLLLQTKMSKDDDILLTCTDEERKAYLKQRKQDRLYEDIEETPFYFNGQGFVHRRRSKLFIYHMDEKHLEAITADDIKVGHVITSADERYVYYLSQPDGGKRVLFNHLYQYDLKKKKTIPLYVKDDYNITFIQILGKKLICAANDFQSYGLNQNDDFYVYENQSLNPFASYGLSIGNTTGSDVRLGGQQQIIVHDKKLYFISTVDDHTELMSLNQDGEIKSEYSAYGSLEGLTVVEDKVYFVACLKQRLQEIYAFNHGREQQLTRLNYRRIKDYYVARPKKFVLKQETHEVTGFALYPFAFDKDKKYPMILDIHGGPKTVYSTNYYHEMQYWANLGYIVIYCNPRGSDGKGDAFADIRGKYGTIDFDDIMNFTDYVIKKIPQIDEQRLYVTGGSYGGFMTNWIVGHTHRFKAAVTQRSISNWMSFFGTSDIGIPFATDQTDANPIDNPDKMWQQSPIKYVNQVKTPTLLIHADEDYRCPIEQAMQFYSALKYNNVETKLIWFKGETHELSRGGKPQARIKRLKDITNWFETH